MIRTLVYLALIGGFIFIGATVPLGKRTLFGHIQAIWNTDEAKDMRDGISEKAAPVVDKVKRGMEAGVKEASKPNPPNATADASPAEAPLFDAAPATSK